MRHFLIPKFEFKKGAVFQNTRKIINYHPVNKSNKLSDNSKGIKTLQKSIAKQNIFKPGGCHIVKPIWF